MTKRFILTCTCFFLLFSCKEGTKQASQPISDSLTTDSSAMFEGDHQYIYVDRINLDLKNYFVSLKAEFEIGFTEDSSESFLGNFLFVFNKTLHTTDTLEIKNSRFEKWAMDLTDLTDSLHFKELVVCISWQGDSDIMENYFAGYSHGALKELFSVHELVSLERKDEWTLSGYASGRDELVYEFQDDYPITVSLKNYEVKREIPDKQYIGNKNIALENIKGYKFSNDNTRTDYTIKKDTRLLIDTLFRKEGRVTFIIADSIKIDAPFEEAKGKLRENAAG